MGEKPQAAKGNETNTNLLTALAQRYILIKMSRKQKSFASGGLKAIKKN